MKYQSTTAPLCRQVRYVSSKNDISDVKQSKEHPEISASGSDYQKPVLRSVIYEYRLADEQPFSSKESAHMDMSA